MINLISDYSSFVLSFILTVSPSEYKLLPSIRSWSFKWKEAGKGNIKWNFVFCSAIYWIEFEKNSILFHCKQITIWCLFSFIGGCCLQFLRMEKRGCYKDSCECLGFAQCWSFTCAYKFKETSCEHITFFQTSCKNVYFM